MYMCVCIYIYICIFKNTHTRIRIRMGVVRRRSHNARNVDCENDGFESMQLCLLSLCNLEIVFGVLSNRMLEYYFRPFYSPAESLSGFFHPVY